MLQIYVEKRKVRHATNVKKDTRKTAVLRTCTPNIGRGEGISAFIVCTVIKK